MAVTPAMSCWGQILIPLPPNSPARVPVRSRPNFPGRVPLTLNLQLFSTNGTGAISGDVTQAGWAVSSSLSADLAQTWTGKNHSPWAGTYTVSLPWNATMPLAGDSYATVTVLGSGILSAVGGLADGSTFNQTVPVSKEGSWPLFAVSTAKDVILGWVSVTTNGPVSTNLLWSKGANKGLYSEGFTNEQVQLIGSPYKAADLPLDLADPAVFLSGGGLTMILTNPVVLEHKSKTSYVSADVDFANPSCQREFRRVVHEQRRTGEHVRRDLAEYEQRLRLFPWARMPVKAARSYCRVNKGAHSRRQSKLDVMFRERVQMLSLTARFSKAFWTFFAFTALSVSQSQAQPPPPNDNLAHAQPVIGITRARSRAPISAPQPN